MNSILVRRIPVVPKAPPVPATSQEKENPLGGLLQNLNEKLKNKLYEHQKRLPNPDTHIGDLLHALQHFDPVDPIFNNKTFPFYALQAVEQTKLPREDFCTLMFYWCLRARTPSITQQDIQSIPLFSDEHDCPKARAILKASFLYAPDKDDPESTLEPVELLDDRQIDDFFLQMRGHSAFEQQFFLIPDKEFLGPNMEHLRTVTNVINQDLGFNVFGRVEVEGKAMRIIPSFSMMQTCLNVAFGENAAEIFPVFLISPLEQLETKILQGKRDFAIPFPHLNLPGLADENYAFGIDFPMHDWYHLFLFSSIPIKDRKKLLDFLQIVKRSVTKLPEPEKFYEAFHSAIVDMEIVHYLKNYQKMFAKENTPYIFWHAVKNMFKKTAMYLVYAEEKNKPHHTSKSLKLLYDQYEEGIYASEFFSFIMKDLIYSWEFYLQTCTIDVDEVFRMKSTTSFIYHGKNSFRKLLPDDPDALKNIALYSENPILRKGASEKLILIRIEGKQ